MKFLASLLLFLCISSESRTLYEATIDGNKAYIADIISSSSQVKADSAIVKSFERVNNAYGVDAKLYVTGIATGIASLPGAVITDTSLEGMTEIQRCFAIAHELSHIKLNHHEQRMTFLNQLVPGDVDDAEVKEKMKWVLFQPEAKEQAWRIELEADEAAVIVLQKLGYKNEEILLAVQGFKILPSTPTHPSTVQRFMNIRRVLGL